MADRSETSHVTTPTPTTGNELADLLRLHFEASRVELSEYLEQWTKKTLGTATTVAVTVALAGLGGLFLLVAAVIAIGDALDHPGWGLLIVGSVLVVAGGAFGLTRWLIDKNQRAQEST